MSKIEMVYNIEEYRKQDILRSIRNMSPFLRSEKTVHHIKWIVPTLLKQMEMSDSEHLSLIARALVSIFQNFIKIEETSFEFMKPLKSMVVEGGIKLLEFYFSKAETFTLKQSFLDVLVSLDPKCTERFRDLVIAHSKDDFMLMTPDNAEMFITQIHLSYPTEIEQCISKWLQEKVLARDAKAKSIDDYGFGTILKRNGIGSIDYKLAINNARSLGVFIKVCTALGRNCWLLEEETFKLILSFFALCSESEIGSVSGGGSKAFATIFEDYAFIVFGSTSTLRFEEYIDRGGYESDRANNPFPKEFQWIIPERKNPERTKQLLTSIFYECLATCDRLLDKIYESKDKTKKLEYPLDLYVEKFYESVINKDTKDEKKPIEHPDLGKLGKNLGLLGNLLDTFYIQLIQLRSNKTRGYIDLFLRKLTQFILDTNTYPSLGSSYLKLYHIRNKTAVKISNMNQNCSKLWDIGKSILIRMKNANFNFQSELAAGILNDYLPINNYCHYSDWLLVDPCIIQDEFKKYPMDQYPETPDKFYWIFSKDLCDFYFNHIITTFFRQCLLFLQSFEDAEMLDDVKDMITGSWLSCSTVDMTRFFLWTVLNVVLLDHKTLENTDKLVLNCEKAFDICMTSYVIPNEEVVFNFLQIGRQFMEKGTYKTVFPVYYKIIVRLLGWSNLPADQNIDHMFKLLSIMQAKSDTSTTLIDLLEASTRFMLWYRSWNAKFRAQLVKYVLTHINSKDLNKRIVYMGIVSFMNRTLRRTDYVFKEVCISHDKFLNQNGYMDTYMLKEAFRQIRFNVGYSDNGSMIFSEEQMKELGQINQDCIPSVVYPSYLSLPFKALTFDFSKENTVKEFRDTLLSTEEKHLYEICLIEFIEILFGEYSEDVDDESLYVGYTSYSELLIDTKGKFKFDKEMCVFASLKIICMFLGLDTIEEVFIKLEQDHANCVDRVADYNKVILSFYGALVGAGGFFTEPEFMRVIKMGKPILKPFFNSVNAKFLEALSTQLNRSLRGNLSYKRLKIFFNMIKDLMKSDTKEHAIYYMNILIFQITISQMILTDELLQTFKDIMEDLKIDDINVASIVSRVFRNIYGTRLLISFNESYIKKARRIVTEDTVSTHIYDKEVVDFDDYVVEFLRTLREQKPWVRIEGVRYITYLILDKKLTSHNVPMFKKMCQILFTFTGSDLREETILTAYRAIIQDIRKGVVVQRHVRDNILNLLHLSWSYATSFECQRGILQIYKLGFNGVITDGIHKFIRTVTKYGKSGLADNIFVFVRDDIFQKIPDNDLFEYAKRVFAEVKPLVDKM